MSGPVIRMDVSPRVWKGGALRAAETHRSTVILNPHSGRRIPYVQKDDAYLVAAREQLQEGTANGVRNEYVSP